MHLIDEYYPNYKDVGHYFKKYLELHIRPGSRILDVGCGRKAFGENYYKRAGWRTGVDCDEEALKSNQLMDEKILSQIEDMPDLQQKFDVVIAQWVLEHVHDPERVIANINSACAKGDHFIFMTTNIYSPVIVLSNFLPTFVKKYLKRTLLNVPENETYGTYYKINTPGKLDSYLTKHGFVKVDTRTVGVLTYFAVNKSVLKFKVFLDKLFFDRFKFFQKFDTHIVGVYRKI